MAINDTSQLSVIGNVLGQEHVHTLHFRHLGPGGDESVLIDEWQASAKASYRALFSTVDSPTQRYRGAQVCGTIPLRAPDEETEPAGQILGTRATATDPLSPFMAAVTSVRTASAGRSRRGRFFIGGIYEGDQSGGNLTGTYLALVVAYHTALLAAFGPTGTSGQFRLVVHSRLLAGVPGALCENSSTLVTGMIARSVLGTMKSRKPGSGL